MDTGDRSELLAADLTGRRDPRLPRRRLARLPRARPPRRRHRRAGRRRSAPPASPATTRCRCPSTTAQARARGDGDEPAEPARTSSSGRRRRASRPRAPTGEPLDLRGRRRRHRAPARRRSSASRRTCARRSGPRSSATSAASAGCSRFDSRPLPRPGARVVDRRRRHQVADRPGRPAASTPSASTSSRCASTTSSCQGAEPLFFLDYIAVGKLDPDHIEQLVEGVAEGCRQAGCALIGGEMAEHPGAMEPGEFDLVGFAVGVVERDQHASPASTSRPGDVLIGLPSPGLRCNGYSLARRVLLERRRPRPRRARLRRARTTRSPTSCSQPSVIYAPAIAALLRRRRRARASPTSPAAASPGNLARVLPDGTSTRSSSAARGRSRGSSPRSSGSATSPTTRWRKVFNLGLGMVVVVARRRRPPRPRRPAHRRPPRRRDRRGRAAAKAASSSPDP